MNLNTILFGMIALVSTIFVYQFFQFVQRRSGLIWLNPMLLSIAVIIPSMLFLGVTFEDYMVGGQVLNSLLEPAVVALGFPLYQQLSVIKKNWLAISILMLVSSAIAIVVSFVVSIVLIDHQPLAVSMALKSITTPIALELSTLLGGINAVTAVAIIIAGLVGAISGVPILNMLGVTDRAAQGLAIGAASHVLGTATVGKESHQRGAFGALALIFCGLFTAIISPVLIPLLASY